MSEAMLKGEFDESVHALRGSLIDLIVSAGGDPRKPQEISRRFGIDKSLCWKVSRVIKATEPSAALSHIPGNAAIEIFLNAFGKAGADNSRLLRVRHAAESLNHTVEKHFGDRPTLDIILDSMSNQGEDRLLKSRKLAFRGNSGIWGVQSRVRVNTILLAPNAEQPDQIDSILIGGWVDFRRLRSDAQWTIFKTRAYRDDDTFGESIPLDPRESTTGPMLLRDFCSKSLPPINIAENTGVRAYELGSSAIGNSGTFTCFFGTLDRKLGSRFAQNGDDMAQFNAMISAPTEALLFDLIVHHSLSFALKPAVHVYGTMSTDARSCTSRDLLPIHPEMQEIGTRPPVVATPLVHNYSQLIDFAFQRAGWDAHDFVGLRYTLKYPPFLSTVSVQLPLEHRLKPGANTSVPEIAHAML